MEKVSNKERIVMYVLQGLTTQEISDIIGIRPGSVKFHLTNIYKEYRVRSRSELIVSLLTNKKPEMVNSSGTLSQVKPRSKSKIKENNRE